MNQLTLLLVLPELIDDCVVFEAQGEDDKLYKVLISVDEFVSYFAALGCSVPYASIQPDDELIEPGQDILDDWQALTDLDPAKSQSEIYIERDGEACFVLEGADLA